ALSACISEFFMTLLFYVIWSYGKLGLDGKLAFSKSQSLLGHREVYATCFEENGTRLNDCYPILRSTFTFTHTYFSRLAGYRLIREDSNPNLTFALHRSRNRNTRCFELTCCNPTTFQRFQCERSEGNAMSAGCNSLYTSLLRFSEFRSFRL